MAEYSEVDDSLPNYVADELRSLIVRGTLLPGEHLGQTQLAKRFGRSKVPIREALKLLSTEGFLRHDRNRGYFVSPLEYPEALQLYKLRRWLEIELLKTAEWPEPEQVARFRKRFDELDGLSPNRDFARWSETLGQIRYEIFDLSPEKVLLREAKRLWTLTDRYRSLFPRNTEGSPERKLIDALEARDRDRLIADYLAARGGVEAALEQAFNIVAAA
ncbi:GntR family transcriptional regulator [Sphingomonas canadensis]|uniref:GntR family transcriptional regulator n=1 Tax=Sphingomonas canadensis TaxID=1219257 RepID=A0ABW3HH11_9SPHN|nr:GntR family transcriptional regulator [Sphingomonas canadensis]MCW3838309.1 GntR family transcriptional regulator [Sphingomonas canadensis]